MYTFRKFSLCIAEFFPAVFYFLSECHKITSFGHTDKKFAFAHNGVLYNDKELRKDKHLPDTNIETDSYVAVQLIEQNGRLNFESLKNMAETVQGNFTFTILSEDNSLYIVKGSNPMFLLHFEEIGLYVYASTESIMKNALKKVGMKNIPFTKIETVHGEILKIDSKGFLSRSEFEDTDYRFIPCYRCSYDYEDDYYNQHEQLLFDICNTFGVVKEDVMLLLDYGYSSNEIEDMLMDYDLLQSTIQSIKYQDYYDDFLMEI